MKHGVLGDPHPLISGSQGQSEGQIYDEVWMMSEACHM